MTRKELILNSVSDLVSSFLYYDRKEDPDLPRGEIEAALQLGELAVTDIVTQFESKLREGLE